MPGIEAAIHGRLGTATPEEIAALIVDAVRTGADRVFCPEKTTRHMYEHPVETRAQIAEDARRTLASLPPNDAIDTLVIGAEHPVILEAREQWEREHGATGTAQASADRH
jgi:hypothetical protein